MGPPEGERPRDDDLDREFEFRLDFGERLGDYVRSVVEGTMRGVAREIERSTFIGPHGIGISRRRRPRRGVEVGPKRVASVMSALGNEHRIRILGELTLGGRYAGELQERLPDISASTLSSHLGVLEEAGLIVQEKARGRYLITMTGRMAYRMALQIARQVEEGLG
ncbi:MAG: ArsR/SmtB family transcription factor [Candidatus Bathyarchaeia archaeon]